MRLLGRIIIASLVSAPFVIGGLLLTPPIFFHTPFASRPLFERLPGVSERFCPRGTRLVVERYGRSVTPEWKNYHRVNCVDQAGKVVAEATNSANAAAFGLVALTALAVAWPWAFWREGREAVARPAPAQPGGSAGRL